MQTPDWIHYIIGSTRYYLWYRNKKLIRPFIREQIEHRINSMRKTCYQEGSCEECGCLTTALQMCSKSCDGNCYPILLSKAEWRFFKIINSYHSKENSYLWRLDKENKKFIRYGEMEK